MVRRSFRIGLRVGILLGLAVAAAKMIQSRRSQPEPAADPWTPVTPDPARAAEPARPNVADAPSPTVGPVTEPGATQTTTAPADAQRPLDEVGEPIETPSPEPAPSTAKKPPAEKAAGKSASKKAAGKKASGADKAKKATASTGAAGAGRAWVEPSDDACPPSHPLKAKLSSKIFHRPGGLNYDRTSPDRCYADEAGAEADGLRAAKR